MTSQPPLTPPREQVHAPAQLPGEEHAHGGRHVHGWAMWLMCLPMLVIVGLQLAGGRAGLGAAVYALACVGMMAAMALCLRHGDRR